MSTLQIVREGFDELTKQVNDPRLVGEAVAHMVAKATTAGEQVARRGAPGSIANTIQSEVSDTQGRIRSTHPAARVIEGGRKPNGPMPPVGPVAEWMARHGIDGSPFVIARAVQRRGIKGRFFMRAARKHVNKMIPGLLAEAGREIVARWQR